MHLPEKLFPSFFVKNNWLTEAERHCGFSVLSVAVLLACGVNENLRALHREAFDDAFVFMTLRALMVGSKYRRCRWRMAGWEKMTSHVCAIFRKCSSMHACRHIDVKVVCHRQIKFGIPKGSLSRTKKRVFDFLIPLNEFFFGADF